MGIPENIDALLVKYDINQDHLARIADVTPGAVTGWRKGSTPRKDAVRNICDYFNLSEDDILSENYGLAAKEYGDFPGISNARPAVGMAMGLAQRLGKVHAGVLAQPDVCDDSIVMASVDGCDYIVRRLRMTANTMILSPESHNPDHEDIIIRRDSEHSLEIPGVITWYQAPREME